MQGGIYTYLCLSFSGNVQGLNTLYGAFAVALVVFVYAGVLLLAW